LQHLRIAVLQFGAHCNCNLVHRFGGRVGAAAAAARSQYWLEYFLARVWDYLIIFCDVLSLGIDALLFVWLSSLGFSSGGILKSRLRCSEAGFDLWLRDEGIVNGKMSTPYSIF
jgi:hypothetical protein